MKNISEFLSKIRNAQTKNVLRKIIVTEIVKKHREVVIDMTKVEFGGGKLILKNLSQTQKTHIFMKKNEILKDINDRFTEQAQGLRLSDVVFR